MLGQHSSACGDPATDRYRALVQVYFGKTRDVVFDLRSIDDLEKARRQRELQKELVGFIKTR